MIRFPAWRSSRPQPIIFSLAALLTLAACSSGGYKLSKEAAKLEEFQPSSILEIRWDARIGDTGNNVLVPAVTQDAIYASNAKGQVFRINPKTGDRVWRIDCGFRISAGTGAGEGLVLVGGVKGELAAFSEDGALRWKTRVTSEVSSAPQVARGIVVVRTADSRISALDATDGKRLWLYERATPALVVRNHAGVTIEGDTVYAGFAGGKLAAIHLETGIVNWETAVSQPRGNTELERISDIISEPVTDGIRVCAVAFQGRLACYGATQGNLLWSRELSSDQGATLQEHYYLTDSRGSVYALDKNSGATLWKNDQLSLRRTTAPLAVDPLLLAGDLEGYLHGLDRADGSLKARLKTDGSPILTPPVALEGGVLLQSQNGRLYSIAIR